VVGRGGIARQGAEAQAAFVFFDDVEARMLERVDVDQAGRRHHAFLHQVEQVGAAGHRARAVRREEGQGGIDVLGLGKGEWIHTSTGPVVNPSAPDAAPGLPSSIFITLHTAWRICG